MMHVSYYAHVRENDTGGKEFQTAAQHLAGTAELCRAFAAAFWRGDDQEGYASANLARKTTILSWAVPRPTSCLPW